jgi:hypothetical protein
VASRGSRRRGRAAAGAPVPIGPAAA